MNKMLLYGAGYQARMIIAQRQLQNENIDAIIVTDPSKNPVVLAGISVQSVDDYIHERENVTVILGVTERYFSEIKEILREKGFSNVEIPNIKPMKSRYFPDATYQDFVAAWYFVNTGEQLDWNHLTTYNEKLQWMKLHLDTSYITELVDKILVRDWIRNKIGERYLVPIYGTWDTFREIDFSLLPDAFVLKCNHGSGYNYIVKNKHTLDLQGLEDIFERWLENDYSDEGGLELQYKNIIPRIYAEEYLRDNNGELSDYKFFVFDGKVRLIQVDLNRFSNHERVLFTPDWEFIPAGIMYPIGDPNMVPKPARLERMIEIAEILGEGFIHVRVDLYFCYGKIYFGEMTFTHGSGIETFTSKELAEKMGTWIRLPDDEEKGI